MQPVLTSCCIHILSSSPIDDEDMTDSFITFARDGVQPPSRFYLRPFERIEIRSWCSVAGVVLGVHGLILTPQGIVQEIAEVHSPNSDRSEASSLYFMSEGFLLHLQIRIESGAILPGECFVTVHIIRGLGGAGVRVSTLFSDYVTPLVAPTYPVSGINQSTSGVGAVRSITGTDPAAGAEISETVPANAKWEILAVRFTLVTLAVAGDRVIHLQLDDGTNIFSDVCVSTVHAASITKIYNFANFGSTQLAPIDCLYIPLPPLPLLAGYRIQTSTENLAVDDDFSAPQLLVKEWLVE
ncbi:hypothetical protein ES705_36779 [subsurface metagenome]